MAGKINHWNKNNLFSLLFFISCKLTIYLNHLIVIHWQLQEHLAGAIITPSEEDSRTFMITCASGDTLKIRAANAASRQQWVDVLRSIAETHNTQVSAIKHNFHRKRFSKKHFTSIGSHADLLPSRENADAYTNARQQIHNTELWYV